MKCKLEYNGTTLTKQAFIINCANIQQLGNQAFIAPKADFTDGLLNITIIQPFGFLGALRLGTRLFLKQIDKIKYTETFTCKRITFHLPPKTPFHCDGDAIPMPSTVTVEAIKQDLKVIIP